MDLATYKQEIFEIDDEASFEKLALQAFRYQTKVCKPYRTYCELLGVKVDSVQTTEEIPFLPISAFRTHQVSDDREISKTFGSSGTTGSEQSRHHVNDLALYEKSLTRGFQRFFGSPEDYTILALLPGYTERTDSSLVYMLNTLIQLSNQNGGGFYLDTLEQFPPVLQQMQESGRRVMLFGVTHALLRLVGQNVNLSPDCIVIETGGMKGNGPELTREALHQKLREAFQCKIASEYGMTELLSQAYMVEGNKFESVPWMKVGCSSIHDPMSRASEGLINIIDLANISSCSFIQTEDLGVLYTDGCFNITGRLDHSELRGCNLLLN